MHQLPTAAPTLLPSDRGSPMSSAALPSRVAVFVRCAGVQTSSSSSDASTGVAASVATPGGQTAAVSGSTQAGSDAAAAGAPQCVRIVSARELEFAKDARGPRRRYDFDGVFGPASTQEEVFNAAARDIALGVCAGVRGAVLAYGMTGSGKTYTMLGPRLAGQCDPLGAPLAGTPSPTAASTRGRADKEALHATDGVLPRACRLILDTVGGTRGGVEPPLRLDAMDDSAAPVRTRYALDFAYVQVYREE
ncbi:hypothetical protein EON68_04750, partial [archaeon]